MNEIIIIAFDEQENDITPDEISRLILQPGASAEVGIHLLRTDAKVNKVFLIDNESREIVCLSRKVMIGTHGIGSKDE